MAKNDSKSLLNCTAVRRDATGRLTKKGRIKWSQRKIHKQICEAIFIKLNFPSAEDVVASLLHAHIHSMPLPSHTEQSKQATEQHWQAAPSKWLGFGSHILVVVVVAVASSYLCMCVRVLVSALIVESSMISSQVNAKRSSFASYCVKRAALIRLRSHKMRSTRTTFSVH